MPGGMRKLLGIPPAPGVLGDEGLPGPPLPERMLGICGAPCLPKWKARIFASIAGGRPPLLDSVDCGWGLRDALTLPKGVEDEVMPDEGAVCVEKAVSSGGGEESSGDLGDSRLESSESFLS